jgi:hypothetical protein
VKARILVLALLAAGCDSQGARDNLETLLCGVLPWYVADCTDPEVQAKALSVLDNGIVEARAECSGVQSFDVGVCTLDSSSVSFTLVKLIDGSVISDKVYSRAEQEGQNTSYVERNGTALKGTFSFFGDGLVTMHKTGCTSVTYNIETVCTGFNLEAFGVE